jgi:hypothetical protein
MGALQHNTPTRGTSEPLCAGICAAHCASLVLGELTFESQERVDEPMRGLCLRGLTPHHESAFLESVAGDHSQLTGGAHQHHLAAGALRSALGESLRREGPAHIRHCAQHTHHL